MKDDSVRPMPSPGQRAASYWFVDGLPDLVFGLMLLIFGALGLWWRIHVPKPWMKFDLLLIGTGFCLVLWKGHEILDFLKSRLTYPRTGYVQPPEEFERTDVLTTLSLKPEPPVSQNVTHFAKRTVWVVFLSFLIPLNQDPVPRWFVPLAMPVLAVALYALNRNAERPYRWWSALILALTGLVSLWVEIPPLLQPLLPLLLAGGWLTAQGLFTLVRYLRANPYPPAPEGVRT